MTESRGVAAWKLPVRREHEARSRLAVREGLGFQETKVRHVLGHERTILGDRGREYLLIRRAFEPSVSRIVNRDDIVSPGS